MEKKTQKKKKGSSWKQKALQIYNHEINVFFVLNAAHWIQARQYVFLVFKQGSKLNKMQGSAEVKQKNAYASFCKYYLFLVLKTFEPFVL